MDRIAKQPNRAGEDRQEQFDQAGCTQADRADRHRPVRRPPIPGVVTDAWEGKRRCGIAQPQGLVHRARMPSGPTAGQIWSCAMRSAAVAPVLTVPCLTHRS